MCDNNRAGLLEQLLHKIKANRRREMGAMSCERLMVEGSGEGLTERPDIAAETEKYVMGFHVNGNRESGLIPVIRSLP